MLDNPSPTWYNGYIIIEMKKEKMNKRFKTGDMIQIGSRENNVALVLGPAFTGVAGGMWWVQRIESNAPIMIFQNASLIKVI